MVHILFQFYSECKKEQVRWDRWSMDNSLFINTVNKLNKWSVECAVLQHQHKKHTPKLTLKPFNWTGMNLWVRKAMENHVVQNGLLSRFGLISLDSTIVVDGKDLNTTVVHMKTLYPEAEIPYPTQGNYMYIDLYWKKKNGRVGRKSIDLSTTPVPIQYGIWERTDQMPLNCITLVTYTVDQNITHWAAGPWVATELPNKQYKVIMNKIQFIFNHRMFLDYQLL